MKSKQNSPKLLCCYQHGSVLGGRAQTPAAAWKAGFLTHQRRAHPWVQNLYLLRLSGFGQHQREKAQADLLVLGGSFTDLKEKSAVAEQMV